MNTLVVLCRSGYESVVNDELTHLLALNNMSGYGQFVKGRAWLEFHIVDSGQMNNERKYIEAYLQTLIFARQIWWKITDVSLENKQDRIGDCLYALQEAEFTSKGYSDVVVEYADTEEGKDVAKFARKFTVPLRQALRAKNILLSKTDTNIKTGVRRLHLLLNGFDNGIIGESIANVSSKDVGGIVRLKFPSASPSRSTLKLEDAILTLLTDKERESIFYPGANAVDLGACPGGWTYQLVKRGLHVEAVDNGEIAPDLMATGQVEHFAEDGFMYKPAYGHVTLLVCDMIEKPDRVAELMATWLKNRLADHAIFNLKLPMKQRFETVNECLTTIATLLGKMDTTFRISAKHLYHDRDEITVCVIAKQ
ncbi:23S rRNA (cytidine(2498)-2'-O)-methyltransferase RlmM [Alteromonas sp. 5E99-2]|uniref:23S rRNA (cytidine(2498)-2'-O)-methyltransferase RlmM n=1 Tax=Alteromonas sp. 5E99-2 TaxID=2817683 RepID=UPI001A98E283|nr:23S rRNA (cytidine(2498)-2'-O)-methyltransferase RlmM [Alteromonas sp. 5E99-2]MBO1254869.1 23S rRNA (cytidine(2498)-2'-O)-methyltransferase RlmM [Alteromonas sp. 5E99-2]